MILVEDKSTYHYKSKIIKKYYKDHKDEIKPVWFPTGCPDQNPVEECWRQAKQEINGGKIHNTFQDMCADLKKFLKQTQFKQDIVKYLRT
jgi:transposase